MNHQSGNLNTRWSMLDQLRGVHAEESWRWFMRRYQGFVVAVLHRVFQDRAEAQRLADEFWGYLFANQAFARADRERRFRSFLSGTVRNFAREQLRARQREPQCLDPDQPPDCVARIPEDDELRLWARTVLQVCLGDLHRGYPVGAKVLCLFYGLPVAPDAEPERLSSSRIAERLDISPSAVHQHLHRGRMRLRRFLEEELEETVHDRSEVDDELALLIGAILGSSPGLIDR